MVPPIHSDPDDDTQPEAEAPDTRPPRKKRPPPDSDSEQDIAIGNVFRYTGRGKGMVDPASMVKAMYYLTYLAILYVILQLVVELRK